MKKALALTLALAMSLALAACGATAPAASSGSASGSGSASSAPAGEPVEIIVFAAASMTETIDQIIEAYKTVAPNVTVIPTYESSGTLLTQIKEGADCDLFISAAQKQMNALDASKDAETNPDGLDFVLQGSRVNLLENKVALVVPEGNAANIKAFADIANCESISLGNDDVPVGQYSKEILTNLGLLEGLEKDKKISYGSNVKEVTTQVSEGAVDCGIVYATDAFSAGLEVVDLAAKDMCKQVIYPAAVLNISKNPETAQAFLDYLKTDEAMAVFQGVGFAPAS